MLRLESVEMSALRPTRNLPQKTTGAVACDLNVTLDTGAPVMKSFQLPA